MDFLILWSCYGSVAIRFPIGIRCLESSMSMSFALLNMSFKLCTLTTLWGCWRWVFTNSQRGLD